MNNDQQNSVMHPSALTSLASLSRGDPVLLVTGATGGLGAGVLPRLLQQRPNAQFVLLIRGADVAESLAKFDSLAAFSEISDEDKKRFVVLRGDVTVEHLGLNPMEYGQLAAIVTDVFHLAADLRFDLSIEESRISNVDSTRRVIELVREALSSNRFARFNYVSTAYISGDRRETFFETDINIGQQFFNAYEQSKMEAEQLVEQFKAEAPITIYRPSMIVGESETGKIRNFFGIYEFLKLMNSGKMPLIPADPLARPDLVPLDYVADGLVFLSAYPEAAGKTYYLAAGIERSISIRDVVTTIGNTVTFERLRKLPEIVPYADFEKVVTGPRLRAFQNSSLNILLKTYMPYLLFERKFEVNNTAQLLAAHGISMRPIETIVPAICQFALDNDFKAHPSITSKSA